MKETIKREESHAGMSYPEREFARHGSGKIRMIFGTIMLVLGMVCASGDTIANGIMACVFMGVAAIALRSARTANENVNDNYAYKKAA